MMKKKVMKLISYMILINMILMGVFETPVFAQEISDEVAVAADADNGELAEEVADQEDVSVLKDPEEIIIEDAEEVSEVEKDTVADNSCDEQVDVVSEDLAVDGDSNNPSVSFSFTKAEMNPTSYGSPYKGVTFSIPATGIYHITLSSDIPESVWESFTSSYWSYKSPCVGPLYIVPGSISSEDIAAGSFETDIYREELEYFFKQQAIPSGLSDGYTLAGSVYYKEFVYLPKGVYTCILGPVRDAAYANTTPSNSSFTVDFSRMNSSKLLQSFEKSLSSTSSSKTNASTISLGNSYSGIVSTKCRNADQEVHSTYYNTNDWYYLDASSSYGGVDLSLNLLYQYMIQDIPWLSNMPAKGLDCCFYEMILTQGNEENVAKCWIYSEDNTLVDSIDFSDCLSWWGTNDLKDSNATATKHLSAGKYYIVIGYPSDYDSYGSSLYKNIPYSFSVTDKTVHPSSVTVVSPVSVVAGSTTQLEAVVLPENASNKKVTWKSNNTSIATVNSSGVVTGVSQGQTIITATTEDGSKTGTCQLTVTSPTVAVTGVTVSPTSKTLSVGQTQELSATVIPSNATNKKVSWKSSNTSVATVSASGVVTAVAAGEAIITATTEDGSKTGTCQITVSDSVIIAPEDNIIIGQKESGVFDASQEVVYDFTVNSSSVYKLSTTYTGANYMNYSIIDKNGTTIWTAQTGYNNTGTATGTNQYALLKGTYKIKLHSIFAKNGDDYSITVSDVYPSENYQSFEETYGTSTGKNDTRTDAFLIEPNHTYNGLICVGNSDDWYKIVVGTDPVTIKTKNVKYQGSAARINVYKGDSESSISKYSGDMSSTFKEFTIDEPGTYYIHIDALFILSNSSDSYEIHVAGDTSSFVPNSYAVNIKTGKTHQIDTASLGSVTFSSADTSIASVNSSGLITGVKKGQTIVYAKNSSDKTVLTVNVTVEDAFEASTPVAGITLNTSKIEMSVDETYTLQATVIPSNATDKTVTWSSTNSDVVSVIDGVLTAHSLGSAVITVDTNDGHFTATCAVIVDPKETYSVVYSGNGATGGYMDVDVFEEGESIIIRDNGFTKKNHQFVAWNTKANGSGKTYRPKDTYAIDANLVLYAQWEETSDPDVPVAGVMLDQNSVVLNRNDFCILTATVLPFDADNQSVVFSSKDSGIASVDASGKVTGVGGGTTKIIVTTVEGDFTDECEVTVIDNYIPVTGMKISDSKLKVRKGMEGCVTANIQPVNATNQDVVFSSNDESIATVTKDGVIHGVSAGTTQIVAYSFDGMYTAACAVTVVDDETGDEGIKLSRYSMDLMEGTQSSFTVKTVPSNMVLKVTSTNPSVARVYPGSTMIGVTANKAGTTEIIVTSIDGTYEKICKVHVYNASAALYDITYKLGIAKNAVNENQLGYVKGESFSLVPAEQEGLVFKGWYADSKYTRKVTGIKSTDVGNKTFYAKWAAIQYKVKYDSAGGSEVKNLTDYLYSTKKTKLKLPKKKGYKCIGWFDEYGELVTFIGGGTYGNKVLTAKYSPVSYKINYKLAGGYLDDDVPYYYSSEDTVMLPTPHRDGCVFVGWKLGKEYVTEIAEGSKGNKTLTAVWEYITYTITYDYQGATPVKNKMTYTVKDAVTLKNPKMKGYKFDGWYDLDGVKVKKIPKGSFGNKYFVANWI